MLQENRLEDIVAVETRRSKFDKISLCDRLSCIHAIDQDQIRSFVTAWNGLEKILEGHGQLASVNRKDSAWRTGEEGLGGKAGRSHQGKICYNLFAGD